MRSSDWAGINSSGEVRHARHPGAHRRADRKSTRLNSSHITISYAVFCSKKKKSTANAKTSETGLGLPKSNANLQRTVIHGIRLNSTHNRVAEKQRTQIVMHALLNLQYE